MICPFCSNNDTRVIDSRLIGGGEQVRRRRVCQDCEVRFTTHETPELNFPRIIKSDGTREPFNEEKLQYGVLKALEKRPVSAELIEVSLNNIKKLIRTLGDREIAADVIGEFVMDELRKLDKVAYVRFASVYRSFEDVQAFLEEIKGLENELPLKLREKQLDLLRQDEAKVSDK
jgi:transcriptional repressor NrdR